MTANNPYLGKSKLFPDHPHLILVPGTILGQWESELKITLRPKAFDLFIYTSGKGFREEFWSAEGPFTQSIHSPANRIILASHSVSLYYSQFLQLLTSTFGIGSYAGFRIIIYTYKTKLKNQTMGCSTPSPVL
jgi:hypothetical protein